MAFDFFSRAILLFIELEIRFQVLEVILESGQALLGNPAGGQGLFPAESFLD